MERKRNKLGKQLCILLLILAMCTVMFPMSLWAKEGEDKLPQEQSNTGSISGTVWLDKNEDGVYDSGESLVCGYEVSLYLASNTNDTVAVVTTDSRGYYTFRDLELGVWMR